MTAVSIREPGSDAEYRFLRYAVNRLAAFSYITWDLGDDLNLYRSDQWTHQTGIFIKELYSISLSGPHQLPYRQPAPGYRIPNWFDFTSFQEWSRSQHAFMLSQRKQQRLTFAGSSRRRTKSTATRITTPIGRRRRAIRPRYCAAARGKSPWPARTERRARRPGAA